MIPQRIQLHFDVATEDQAAELSAAWQEIVSGKRTRLNTAAEDTNEIMERGARDCRESSRLSRSTLGRAKRADWSGFLLVSTTATISPSTSRTYAPWTPSWPTPASTT
jgi:hypothetical protein